VVACDLVEGARQADRSAVEERLTAEVLQHERQWVSTLVSLGCFWLPPAGIFLYLIGREWRRLRGELQAQAREDRMNRAEGYSPPGPPTTDSLPR
jgi:hypothetical protein